MASQGRAIDTWLDTVLQGAPVKVAPQKVDSIEDENVRKVFAGDKLYDISFATWPVAPRLPKQLSHEMIARVPDHASIETIGDEETLKTFLTQALANVRGEDEARAAVLASLRLAEAVSQAGSYPFGKPEVSVARQDGNIVATARAAAQEPGRGKVEVRMEFGPDGKTQRDAITIDDQTRRGPPGRR
jgi:hypothetical protein